MKKLLIIIILALASLIARAGSGWDASFNTNNPTFTGRDRGQVAVRDTFQTPDTTTGLIITNSRIDIKKPSAATYRFGNGIYSMASDLVLNSGFYSNSDQDFYVNYAGYNNGYTRYRSTIIADGKTNPIAYFKASDKSTTFYGLAQGSGTDNRCSFARVGFQAYAKGTRPASPSLGDIIVIDGDGNTDSLLVYLGGTWKLIKD
jgi:hypothetical protein